MTILLNLGSGKYPLKGFTNIDIWEMPNVDLVCDILELPYEDNSVDEINCGHCIEHLTMENARLGLKEWIRVLKNGGTIGIVVPEKDLTPKNMIDGLDMPENPYSKHLSYWNLEMLKNEVKNAGFEDIEEINIDTYPYLVARPKWQVGVTARKGGKITNMKKEKSKRQEVEIKTEIPKFNPREESWCKHEKKVVYNPTKKLHCPRCGGLL